MASQDFVHVCWPRYWPTPAPNFMCRSHAMAWWARACHEWISKSVPWVLAQREHSPTACLCTDHDYSGRSHKLQRKYMYYATFCSLFMYNTNHRACGTLQHSNVLCTLPAFLCHSCSTYAGHSVYQGGVGTPNTQHPIAVWPGCTHFFQPGMHVNMNCGQHDAVTTLVLAA